MHHIVNTTSVNGIVKAQYTQRLFVLTFGPLQSSDGTAKSAARKVPGKKAIVMIAMVFIKPLSSLVASACRFAIRAKICWAQVKFVSLPFNSTKE